MLDRTTYVFWLSSTPMRQSPSKTAAASLYGFTSVSSEIPIVAVDESTIASAVSSYERSKQEPPSPVFSSHSESVPQSESSLLLDSLDSKRNISAETSPDGKVCNVSVSTVIGAI